jgi:hypothetical protein
MEGEKHVTLLARREFALRRAPKRGVLSLSAAHVYRVYVNGHPVGRGPDRADPRRPYFDRYDVAPFLKRGRNVILCELYHMTPTGANRAWCLYGGPGGFRCELAAEGARIPTGDGGWRMRRAPGWPAHEEFISRFVGYKHVVDLGEAGEIVRAMKPGYDDSSWTVATPLPVRGEGALPRPVPREQPLLVRTEREAVAVGTTHPLFPNSSGMRFGVPGWPETPPTVLPCAEGAWVELDFGRSMGGFPQLEFESSAGGRVDVYCAEGGLSLMTDRLTLPAKGRAAWEAMDWRGARHVKLHFRDLGGPVVLRAARFIEMVYPFEARGEFRCADETLTRLWAVCRETAWAAVKDHPVDCVNREQALWIEDLLVHARSIAACFGDLRPVVKALRQSFRAMHPDGVVPVPGPVGLGYQRTPQSLPWSVQPLTLPMTLRDVWMHGGDRRLAREFVPGVATMLGHFARYEDQRGLLRTNPPGLPALVPFGGWNSMQKEGVCAAMNFNYLLALNAAATLAEAAGRAETAATWRRRAAAAGAAARVAFWDAERSLFVDGEVDGGRSPAVCPTVNAWGALAGLLRPGEIGGWAEALRRDPGILGPVSPYDATLLLEAFAHLGLDLHTRDLLDGYFGSIVRAGHPTVPEFWKLDEAGPARRLDDFSRCHPYGSGPAYVLHQAALGVRPATAGWSRAVIRPATLGLSWAGGCVPTPRGDIRVSWERGDGSWKLDVELPAGVTAELRLPRLGWGDERLVVNGRTEWSAARWPALRGQFRREAVAKGPRVAACVLSPGRSCVLLEST